MDIKKKVRDRYAAAARQVRRASASGGEKASCCCGDSAANAQDPITKNLYDDAQLKDVPAEAALASLGCGNPTALADLKTGEVVLDLGSGGGIDVILSARRVGPAGKAYGLDMTDEMVDIARSNQKKAGVENIEFLKGEMENIPLPDGSVDVVISNCVINLSPDKKRVLGEVYRVLKPGGRLAVADIVARGPIPMTFAATWSSGRGASRAPWKRANTAVCSRSGVRRCRDRTDADFSLGRRRMLRRSFGRGRERTVAVGSGRLHERVHPCGEAPLGAARHPPAARPQSQQDAGYRR